MIGSRINDFLKSGHFFTDDANDIFIFPNAKWLPTIDGYNYLILGKNIKIKGWLARRVTHTKFDFGTYEETGGPLCTDEPLLPGTIFIYKEEICAIIDELQFNEPTGLHAYTWSGINSYISNMIVLTKPCIDPEAIGTNSMRWFLKDQYRAQIFSPHPVVPHNFLVKAPEQRYIAVRINNTEILGYSDGVASCRDSVTLFAVNMTQQQLHIINNRLMDPDYNRRKRTFGILTKPSWSQYDHFHKEFNLLANIYTTELIVTYHDYPQYEQEDTQQLILSCGLNISIDSHKYMLMSGVKVPEEQEGATIDIQPESEPTTKPTSPAYTDYKDLPPELYDKVAKAYEMDNKKYNHERFLWNVIGKDNKDLPDHDEDVDCRPISDIIHTHPLKEPANSKEPDNPPGEPEPPETTKKGD